MRTWSSDDARTVCTALKLTVGPEPCVRCRNMFTLVLFTFSFAMLVGIVTSFYDIPVRITRHQFLQKQCLAGHPSPRQL